MLNTSLLKLFHVAVDDGQSKVSTQDYLTNGIIFVDNKGVLSEVSNKIVLEAYRMFGLQNGMWSSSFHKTWNKVAEAPIEQLVFEQVIHYFSTYGMEALGLRPMPVIPCEEVITDPNQRPDRAEVFTVIRIVDQKTAVAMVNDYLRVANKINSMNLVYVKDIVKDATLDVEEIKSFEIKALYCKETGRVPSDGQDFLRYVVYLATGNVLLINNADTINAIKRTMSYGDTKDIISAFKHADLVELAKVFLRKKDLFLAFRSCNELKPTINLIRRLAVKHHKPVSDLVVANIMSLLSKGEKNKAIMVLDKASVRDLIKLQNFTVDEGDIHVYNIRNGKAFVREKTADSKNLVWLYKECDKRIKSKLSGKLEGKIFYIPSYIDYAAPVTEKQMVGNMPYGTRLTMDDMEAFNLAVYWENYPTRGDKVDLDLSAESIDEHIAWNSSYRTENVLFSGDMTDATNGAVESLRFNKSVEDPYLITLYNFSCRDNVPFKIFVTAPTKPEGNGRCAVCDVKDALITPIDLTYDKENNYTLGFVKGKSFTFYTGKVGNNIVGDKEKSKKILDAVTSRVENSVRLKDLIEMAGGKIVTEVEEGVEVIDLSPSNITERSLFDIID